MKILNYSDNNQDNTITVRLKLSEEEFKLFNPRDIHIESIAKMSNEYLDAEDIIRSVCKVFRVRRTSLSRKHKSSGKIIKKNHFVEVRRLCYYYIRKYTNLGLAEIGSHFSQDHSNVFHHIRLVDIWKESDKELQKTMRLIESKITIKAKRDEKN